MSSGKKQLSNSFSSGGGGAHFEAHVQASYVVLMLTGGYAPCLPCWPICEIKLQGKVDGFETDDFIVFVQNPNGSETRKLFGQVKHGLQIGDNERFRAVIQAAWDDFSNPKVFNQGKDVIAAISDGLSSAEIAAAHSLLNEAQHPSTDEFFRRVNLARYHSDKTRDLLEVFRETLKNANNNQDLTDLELHKFLRHFRLLGYDLGKEEGVVLSLLHSHISQRCIKDPGDIWGKIVEFVQNCNQSARPITKETIPEDLLEDFRSPAIQLIPKEIAQPQSPQVSAYGHDVAQAFLLGSWDERSAGDIEIVTELTAQDYEKWIPPIREALETAEVPLGLRNGTWTTKRNMEIWAQLGKKIYDADLIRIEAVAIKVLSETNPAFELPAEDRFMANIKGKVLRYSHTIRKGIADVLAIMGSCPHVFTHCADKKPETAALMVVRQVLGEADWQRWGSLNILLPLLAEAAPDEFLSAVENALQQDPCPFIELFAQEGNGVMGNNYMTGLLWALETLAWDEDYLARVTVVLGDLSTIDPGGNWSNRPINSLQTIFMPWCPQTRASSDKRQTAIHTLVKEVPAIAWQALISLLPRAHQITMGSHKPRWREGGGLDAKVPIDEYWKEVTCYEGLAIDMAGNDPARLKILVSAIGNISPAALNKLLGHLQSASVVGLPENERSVLWSTLVEFTVRHRRFADAEWALKEDVLKQIDIVVNILAPKEPENLYKRLFSGRNFELYERNRDWREQDKELEGRQKEAVREIYLAAGIEGVMRFAESVQSTFHVGVAFGAIASDVDDAIILPSCLFDGRECIKRFASSYVWSRYAHNGWAWAEILISEQWSPEQQAAFLACLPFGEETWARVEKYLGAGESLYWKIAYCNPFQVAEKYEYVIDKLLDNGRPRAALECLNTTQHKKLPFDHNRTVKALLAAVSVDEQNDSMDVYHAIELIKALQEDPNTDQDNLFRVEWAYLSILNGHNGAIPKLLEHKLASDPDFFCEVIRLVFRSRNDEEERESTEEKQKLALHAYQLLQEWKTPPSILSDNTFSPDAFGKWLKAVKDQCGSSGHIDVALSQLGQVLIYAPPDPTGLWIHSAVAEALNAKDAERMRRGFHTGIFNSRGVVTLDPSGAQEDKLAAEYKAHADSAEAAGFHRLATTMRQLSEWYASDAKRIRKDHSYEKEVGLDA